MGVVTWAYSTLERQWVCQGCQYMRPGAQPAEAHDCTAVAEPAAQHVRAADDADAIHARIQELRKG